MPLASIFGDVPIGPPLFSFFSIYILSAKQHFVKLQEALFFFHSLYYNEFIKSWNLRGL